MNIQLHRIYEQDSPQGYRALIDRLWPRGISKQEAELDAHWKDIAPSTELRKWFKHDPDKWEDFRKKYMHELDGNKQKVKEYFSDVDRGNLVLLYSEKAKDYSHAHVLKEYLEKLI